jgi:signal transduction histidine kinase
MKDKIDLNILYVEDNKHLSDVFTQYLDEFYSNVYTAKNGKDGIKIFDENDIDVVITDIKMPYMDGLEMSKYILEKDENVSIIVTSSFDDSSYLYKAINMGINNYFLKPVDTEKIHKKLLKISLYKQDKINLNRYKNKLEDLNKTLTAKVEEEIKKNKQKDTMMLTQSKSAQMGELLSMIAHQWRQPLNAISADTINIALKNQLKKLSEDDIEKHTKFIEKQTQQMSKTIEDFMNFFKPESEKNEFCVKELLEKINSIVSAQLKSRTISLKLIGEDIKFKSYEKELSNVFLNLISNSRDAYECKPIQNKEITIKVIQKDDGYIEIAYTDNAGGIDEKIIDKVFDPYFTTKEQGKGTGIGLHMTKRIIAEVLKGEVLVQNTQNGAKFTITLPLIK